MGRSNCFRCGNRTTGAMYCSVCTAGLQAEWKINLDPPVQTQALDTIEHSKLLGTIEDNRGVLTVNTLVHGPGATDNGWRAGDNNSAVFACLMALSMSFIEPPLRVYRRSRDSSDPTPLPNHAIQKLIDDPNPHLDLTEILWWLEWAKHCDGNAYLRKIRSGNERTGNVVELWPLSPTLCEPVTYRGSDDFISAYRYQYAPAKYEDIPVENIVHFRLGIDDRDMRRGLAPLKRLVRLISSDDEASRFANALLTNFGVPGLVVIPSKDNGWIDKEKAEEIKQRASTSFGTDNRGNVAVLSGGADIKQFGFSPHDLNLKELHQIPETRVCAVMRVPPAVAGVSVGLEQTSNYASFREVREMFVEGTLLPEWRMDAAKLTHSLVPDFTNDQTISIQFDTSEVRALQQDMDALYTRLDLAVQHGWLTADEARAEIGKPPLPAPVVPPALSEQPMQDQQAADQQTAAKLVELIAERKARGLDGLPAMFEALISLAEPGLERDLAGYLDSQKRRVQRRLIGGG